MDLSFRDLDGDPDFARKVRSPRRKRPVGTSGRRRAYSSGISCQRRGMKNRLTRSAVPSRYAPMAAGIPHVGSPTPGSIPRAGSTTQEEQGAGRQRRHADEKHHERQRVAQRPGQVPVGAVRRLPLARRDPHLHAAGVPVYHALQYHGPDYVAQRDRHQILEPCLAPRVLAARPYPGRERKVVDDAVLEAMAKNTDTGIPIRRIFETMSFAR